MRTLWIIVGILAIILIIWLIAVGVRRNEPTTVPQPQPTTITPSQNNTPAPPTTSLASVEINNLSFGPSSLEISKGTTVTWKNNDLVTHTVISDNGQFASPEIPSGGTYQFLFDETGTFTYHCSVHPQMNGSITIK